MGSENKADANSSLDIVQKCFERVKRLINKRYTKAEQKKEEWDHMIVISKQGASENKKLELICFNSAYPFEMLLEKKPRSLILTSGTLSPLDVFAKEIGVDFKYKLVNSHVINKEQILINVLKSGFDS